MSTQNYCWDHVCVLHQSPHVSPLVKVLKYIISIGCIWGGRQRRCNCNHMQKHPRVTINYLGTFQKITKKSRVISCLEIRLTRWQSGLFLATWVVNKVAVTWRGWVTMMLAAQRLHLFIAVVAIIPSNSPFWRKHPNIHIHTTRQLVTKLVLLRFNFNFLSL